MRFEASLSAGLRNPQAALLELDRLDSEESLAGFIRRAWPIIEPGQPYVHGWHIDAIAAHLEAITAGQITRLLINVPPGTMKSLATSVFWPAWEWGPKKRPSTRVVAASHSMDLAIRDNLRARRLVASEWYQALWGDQVKLTGDQNAKGKFENTATGFRQAVAAGSITGARGDRVIIDDPLSVDGAASDAVRESVAQWFTEAVPTRLNNPDRSAIVVIMQRLHEKDVSGLILARDLGYDHLMLPMEFEVERKCVTSIGFEDPRSQDGELLFPARFPRHVVDRDKNVMGSYATAGQFQQRPAPRDGGMFKRRWFEIIPAAPANPVKRIRKWDLAATANGGDWTVGVRMLKTALGFYIIDDVVRFQGSAHEVETAIRNTATLDGRDTEIRFSQDPGQAGKAQASTLVRLVAGFVAKAELESGKKDVRAQPFAAQAEAGNVRLVHGRWNEAFLAELETFPNGAHDDQVDAASGAFNAMTEEVQAVHFG